MVRDRHATAAAIVAGCAAEVGMLLVLRIVGVDWDVVLSIWLGVLGLPALAAGSLTYDALWCYEVDRSSSHHGAALPPATGSP